MHVRGWVGRGMPRGRVTPGKHLNPRGLGGAERMIRLCKPCMHMYRGQAIHIASQTPHQGFPYWRVWPQLPSAGGSAFGSADASKL